MTAKTNKYCSQEQAGRYLLNRMSPEEETQFQEHLENCKECREYVDNVRKLGGIISGESVKELEENKPAKRLHLKMIIGIAASILLILTTTVYILNRDRENGELLPLNTETIEMNRADYKEMSLEINSPDKDTVYIYIEEAPSLFKWNKNAKYTLQLKANKRIISEKKGEGKYVTLDEKDVRNHHIIDYTLKVDNIQKTGRIYMKEQK